MNSRPFHLLPIIFFVLVLLGPGIVSAYSLSLEAPAEVQLGQPIQVTGTTNLPPPDKIEIVLSHSVNIPVEKARQSIPITERGDTNFNVTFETEGLVKGNYKIEALSQTQRDFSAGSKNLRVVKITDRSDIIRFSSPAFQDFEGALQIEARIQGYEDKAIQMEVITGNETIFGPESIPVTRGLVKYELPITNPGEYSIIFHDYKGYVGTYKTQVGESEPAASETKEVVTPPVHETEEAGTLKPTSEITPEPTTQPATTQTTRTPTVTETSTESVTPKVTEVPQSTSGISSGSGVTATTKVSRDAPAYFLVTIKQTPVTISTSTEDDWVMEYKVQPDAASVKVNDKGKNEAETVTISEDTKEVFLKVYPYSYKSTGEVTITASNAESVSLSDAAAKAYGAPPRYGNTQTTGTSKSPAPLAGIIIGLACAVWLKRRD